MNTNSLLTTTLLFLLSHLGLANSTVAPDATSGDVGQFTSSAVVNGKPAISYYESGDGNLRYVRASDNVGTSWDAPVTVASIGLVGLYTSLAVVDGNPAISFYDQTNGDLKFVRATDVNGVSWGPVVTLDSAGMVGLYTSLAVIDGCPAISYYDETNYRLKYVRASDASGTEWAPPVTVDRSGLLVGLYTSLATVNGRPAISYEKSTIYDAGQQRFIYGSLKYVRASDPAGTNWGVPVFVATGGAGRYSSLVVINGNPAISYYDHTNADLKYVRASDPDGLVWGSPITLDSFNIVGLYTSLATISGLPAISYYDSSAGNLKFIRATDASGASWSSPVLLDFGGDVGRHTSLLEISGRPAMSYYDASYGILKWTTVEFDADADGLLDAWELKYWPTINGHGPFDDYDKDGYVELLELALGLSPRVPNVGGLPYVIEEAGYLTMTINKQSGVAYEIQSAGTLLPNSPESFSSNTTTVLMDSGSTLKVRDNTVIGTAPSRYLRLQVTAAP